MKACKWNNHISCLKSPKCHNQWRALHPLKPFHLKWRRTRNANEEDGQPYLDVKFELNKDIANIIEIVNSILLKMHKHNSNYHHQIIKSLYATTFYSNNSRILWSFKIISSLKRLHYIYTSQFITKGSRFLIEGD